MSKVRGKSTRGKLKRRAGLGIGRVHRHGVGRDQVFGTYVHFGEEEEEDCAMEEAFATEEHR